MMSPLPRPFAQLAVWCAFMKDAHSPLSLAGARGGIPSSHGEAQHGGADGVHA